MEMQGPSDARSDLEARMSRKLQQVKSAAKRPRLSCGLCAVILTMVPG